MEDKMIKIRNQHGRLVCIICFVGSRWRVYIKDHQCYTDLGLDPDGTYKLTNRIIGEEE